MPSFRRVISRDVHRTNLTVVFLLVATATFNFPFEPYQIQEEFMRGLYATIYRRQHGIFESPTGTVITYLADRHALSVCTMITGQESKLDLRLPSMAIRRDSIVEGRV